ncbi:beta-N-acetylhexosaminidase [Paracholeplasma manati]|uniref:beta-N-acetylhexosaminidase n=1 Tax=Paracholeplasma manati TaxID=591373 RepID=UPI00240856DE|nr:beta-N-acetylhexosaminidase [Paracholeplasma manati]MDG0888743.1 beta-N-acetylhexosaminidase [Paracholeplasma manati]
MTNDINKLSLEEKIGQLFMFGIQKDHLDEVTKEMIVKYKLGNVILFARNCISPEQLFQLNQSLQLEATKHLRVPMFISIDQEGGMVTRIFNGATFFPGAMTIAATDDVEYALKNGTYMAEELDALGINMNLAPILDVNNNPKNPVIGVRSFSDDPHKVSQFSEAFFKGQQTKILSTGKHFPGHGDTHLDSHLALPKVDYDLDRLEAIELVPFRNAIQKGIHALMTSHIDFPVFSEQGLPATLSKKCLTEFLRNDLGFEGLIVTDGMEMKAVQDAYGTVEASLMAVQAGANLVCICHSYEYQIQAFERFKQAVLTNELPMSVLDERVSRVLKYKTLINTHIINQTYLGIESVVVNEMHKAYALETVRRAATLVKGDIYQPKGKTLFIGVSPQVTSGADDTEGNYLITKQIKASLPDIGRYLMPVNPSDEVIQDVVKKAKGYDQIVVTTYNGNIYQQQLALIDQLQALSKEVYVVSMRNPYDLHFNPNIKNYVCLYEYTPNSMTILIEYLKGQLTLKGRLPIHG